MRTLDESTHFVSGRFRGSLIDILAYACDIDEAEDLIKKFLENPDFTDLHIGETQNAGYSDFYE